MAVQWGAEMRDVSRFALRAEGVYFSQFTAHQSDRRIGASQLFDLVGYHQLWRSDGSVFELLPSHTHLAGTVDLSTFARSPNILNLQHYLLIKEVEDVSVIPIVTANVGTEGANEIFLFW
jgi:hypothetical protein